MTDFSQFECHWSREDCRFEEGYGTSTDMGWMPTYDRQGNLLNSDPNVQTWRYSCQLCGAEFSTSTCGGETSYSRTDGGIDPREPRVTEAQEFHDGQWKTSLTQRIPATGESMTVFLDADKDEYEANLISGSDLTIGTVNSILIMEEPKHFGDADFENPDSEVNTRDKTEGKKMSNVDRPMGTVCVATGEDPKDPWGVYWVNCLGQPAGDRIDLIDPLFFRMGQQS